MTEKENQNSENNVKSKSQFKLFFSSKINSLVELYFFTKINWFVIIPIILAIGLLFWIFSNVNDAKISSFKKTEIINTTKLSTNIFTTITNADNQIIINTLENTNTIEKRKQARTNYYILISILFCIATIAYCLHFGVVMKKFKKGDYKKKKQRLWYLFVITLVLPVAFSFLPSIRLDPNILTTNLWSLLLYNFLTSLIMVLLTTELATLFANLRQNDNSNMENIQHLLVAIVLDIYTFFCLNIIPNPRDSIAIYNLILLSFVLTSIFSFLSSFSSIFLVSFSNQNQNNSVTNENNS